MTAPVRVLAVCTGNVCRSPAIQFLVAAALTGDEHDPQVIVTSRGTKALVGEPVSSPMATLLSGVGAPATDFVARPLDAHAIETADLVLTATRAHRSAVVSSVPAALRRTFTLLELARLASQVPFGALKGDEVSDRLRALVAEAPTYRSIGRRPTDDIEDPWGKPDAVYRRCFDTIFGAVLTLVDVVVR